MATALPIADKPTLDLVYAKLEAGIISPLSAYFPMGTGSYPFNGDAPNITISSNTTWSDACGYKRISKLTINAGRTLTIAKSPFYIFCDELVFGNTASCIDISGQSGGAAVVFSNVTAKGGTLVGDGKAQGGCGGGMLIIVTNNVSGASGIIKANGGNGYAEDIAVSKAGQGGQGALSGNMTGYQEQFGYGTLAFLAPGYGNGATAVGATGGGSGSRAQTAGYGGSGVGAGGTATDGTASFAPVTGASSPFPLSLGALLALMLYGCLGGGGGGATTGTSGSAGGGGGGAIGIITKATSVTPTLQANGGSGSGLRGADGGAGLTKIYNVGG